MALFYLLLILHHFLVKLLLQLIDLVLQFNSNLALHLNSLEFFILQSLLDNFQILGLQPHISFNLLTLTQLVFNLLDFLLQLGYLPAE